MPATRSARSSYFRPHERLCRVPGPGTNGQVCCLVLAVAFADRDPGPRLGGDIHRSPDALVGPGESLGGRCEEVVGVVRAARMAAFRAEKKVVRRCRVIALAREAPIDQWATAGGL